MTETPAESGVKGALGKLRDRKVVQWGLAYSAGAWGFQQGVAYVSSLLHWPDQLQELVGLALLLGLPVTLTLAWYHGDKGEQRLTRAELAILTLLFLVGGGLFWRYEHAQPATNAVPVRASSTEVAPNDHSIAVLPFVNMSPDKDQEYFADGVSEEILNLLTQVPQLRVIARTSSFSFKGKDTDIAEIAGRLHVANVLQGSVRRSGDTLRISAQLVRAADGAQLWSQTFDRQLTDVFGMQDEIAADVVATLKVRLLGPPPKARPVNVRAYALYLQARELGRGNDDAMQKSIALFEEALALQPDFAEAQVGLATDYVNQGNSHLRPMDEAIRLGRAAARKALEIDPNSGAAYAVLGYASLVYGADLADAAQQLQRALALAPTSPVVLNSAALLANALGRREQAIALIEYVIGLDPANPITQQNGGLIYLCAERYDESLAHFSAAATLSPARFGNHFAIGMLTLQSGDPHGALAAMQQESREPMRLVGLSIVNHALGRNVESDAALDEAIQKFGTDAAFQVAMAYALRNDPNHSFQWLDKAVKASDSRLFRLAVEPWFKNLHADPRWDILMRKLGLSPEQRSAVKFEATVPS